MKIFEDRYRNFLKDMEVRNYSPTSILKYGHCVKVFLEYAEQKGITDLRAIGKPELNRYAIALRQNPKYSVQYVASHIRAMKCFFRYLKKSGVVFYDFSANLKEPKIPYQLPKEPLTPQEVKKMLEAPDLRTAQGVRDRAILETFYSTGIRLQEMAHLTLMDLDLENGYLTVREGKGRKDRTVPLGKHACFFIQTYLESVRPLWVDLAPNPSGIRTNRLWIGK